MHCILQVLLPSTTCIIKLCWCRSYCTHYYLMCFGTLCHGMVIGHALHPVPLANLLHMLLFPVLRHFLAQCGHRACGCPALRTSNEPTAQYILVDDRGLRTYKFLLRAYDLLTRPPFKETYPYFFSKNQGIVFVGRIRKRASN